jgi:hypothetical protein
VLPLGGGGELPLLPPPQFQVTAPRRVRPATSVQAGRGEWFRRCATGATTTHTRNPAIVTGSQICVLGLKKRGGGIELAEFGVSKA